MADSGKIGYSVTKAIEEARTEIERSMNLPEIFSGKQEVAARLTPHKEVSDIGDIMEESQSSAFTSSED